MHRNKMTKVMKLKPVVMMKINKKAHLITSYVIITFVSSSEVPRFLNRRIGSSKDRDPRLNQPWTPLYRFPLPSIMESLSEAAQGNPRMKCAQGNLRDGNQSGRKSSCLRPPHNRRDFRPLTFLTPTSYEPSSKWPPETRVPAWIQKMDICL